MQKHQRPPELIAKFLDLVNIFLVNLVRNICTMGDLIDIVGDVIRKSGEPFQLVLVHVNDIGYSLQRSSLLQIR